MEIYTDLNKLVLFLYDYLFFALSYIECDSDNFFTFSEHELLESNGIWIWRVALVRHSH